MSNYYDDLVKLMRPLPSNWEQLTKEQLALARIPDWQYDSALPQDWLTYEAAGNHEKYLKILARTVWIYPPGLCLGAPLDLVDGRVCH